MKKPICELIFCNKRASVELPLSNGGAVFACLDCAERNGYSNAMPITNESIFRRLKHCKKQARR